MKQVLFLLLAIVFLFSGCDDRTDDFVLATPNFEETMTSKSEVTPMPITTSTPAPAPLHSELYIPDVPVEDVITYFNEVCLDAEYVTSGDPSRVQKWNSPIRYYIFGTPTAEDLQQLEKFCDWLNNVEGFPGISLIDNQYDANLKIYFCDSDTMLQILGNPFYGNDAGVTFWYDNDMIYDASICIRSDLTQYLRNSVILEEIYNGLGPVQDTVLREDSIIYSNYSEPQELTAVDELILTLLYHPEIKYGMNAEECETIIRQLYY